jgi:probable phosphoglycerate mutase
MLSKVPFWFLRHGETDWNATGRTQGNVEVPLNGNGVAQARAAALTLRNRGIRTIVASTLGRARQTATIVSEALGLAYSTDPGLIEASFGSHEGGPMGTWYEDWVNGRYQPPGGESFATVQARATMAANRALALPGPVLIIGHGGLFRGLRAEMGLAATVRTANGVPMFCKPAGTAWNVTAYESGTTRTGVDAGA